MGDLAAFAVFYVVFSPPSARRRLQVEVQQRDHLVCLDQPVPLLAGVFWGGPLIAREIEQDTHRLAWTQSISRGRWLAANSGSGCHGGRVIRAAARS